MSTTLTRFLPRRRGFAWRMAMLLVLSLGGLRAEAQNLLTEGFENATFPPTGWTSAINTGSYNWQRVQSQSTNPYLYPLISAHSGDYMACFKSFSASSGYGAELRTPVLDFTAAGVKRVTFWMYRDDGYSFNADRIEVYVNTTAASAGGTLLGTVNRAINMTPTVSSNGWYKYEFIAPTSFNTNTNYVVFKAISAYGNDMFIDDVSIDNLPPCTATPSGGTAVAAPASICPGTTTTLTATGVTVAGALTYQWEQYNGTAWVNATGGTGATTLSYVTDLLNVTTQFRLRVNCTNGSPAPAPGYSTPVTVTVSAPLTSWNETFEGITANNQLPTCMTATSPGNATLTYTSNQSTYYRINHTPSGSKFASFRYGANDWFFSPQMTLQAGQSYVMSFWYITDGYANSWQQLKASFGSSASPVAMTNTIGTPLSNLTNTTYKQFIGIFTVPTTGPYNVGIYCQGTGGGWYLSIDDINVQAIYPCAGGPTAGTLIPSGTQSGCPGTSYELSATGTTLALGITYQWLQSTNSAPAWVPAVGGSGATTSVYTTPALIDTIRYRLKVTCTNSNSSDTSAPVTFNITRPVYAPMPFTESFEAWSSRCGTNDIPSTSWTNVPFTGDRSWRRYDQGSSASWTSPTSGGFTPQAAVGTYSARYHGYYGSPSPSFLSAYVNCTGGNPGNKELRFYHRNYSNIYANDTLKVAYSTDGGATFTDLAAYSGTSGAWQQESMVLPSTSATTVIRFSASIAYQYYGDLGLDYVQVLGPCAGKPAAGSINPLTTCANTQFTLTTTGTTIAAGLTYLWQKSPNGVDWIDVTPNGTSATLNQSINSPTWYRMLIKCTYGNQADTTAPYLVQLQNFYACYCTSNASIAATNEDIGNVTIKSQPNGTVLLNNGVGTPVASNSTAVNAYTNFTALTPTPLYRDSTYNFSVQQISAGNNAAARVAIYIDTNRDGVFQTTELILMKPTSAAGGWNVNGDFAIPTNARIGITGMRVILWRGTTVPPPCGVYNSYGETEDYLVNISYRPCTGPSNAGTAYASASSTCAGYPINLGDTTYEKYYSRLTRVWQFSIDGGVTWQLQPNSLNKDTLQDVVIGGPRQFRVRMVCHATGDTTYSNAVNIAINQPYQCYCYSMANGGFLKLQDTSDIGSFRFGNYVFNTGGPHLVNPEASRRRTDYTAPPNMNVYADSTYSFDVYHILRRNNHADAKITLFMDFNNNLQYDAPQERVWTGYSTASNWYVNGSVTIPHAVVPETPTGMRLILNNNVGPNSPSDDGCGSYVSGETEDYVVVFHYANKLGLQNGNQNLTSLAVYPNPTDGRFTVSYNALSSVKHAELTVTNMTGQQMISRSYDNTGTAFSTDLDLTQFARGVYFVELRADGEKLLRKLVVR